MTGNPFDIQVIGGVAATFGEPARTNLSPASRQLLALLVAAGPDGITISDLALERDPGAPPSEQTVRMAVARLRKQLPELAFPRANDGLYRLGLPASRIDAWALEQLVAAKRLDFDAVPLERLLGTGRPFDNVASTPLLEMSERQILLMQGQLLMALAEHRPDLVSGPIASALIDHVEVDPTNELLVGASARALDRLGRRSEALRLLRASRRELSELGLDLSIQLVELETELLEGSPAVSQAEGAVRRPIRLPGQLSGRLDGRYVGDRSELQLIQAAIDDAPSGTSTALLTGVSGSGKSRLCAESAKHAIEQGWSVALLAPSMQDGQAPLAPLLAHDPLLVEDVANALSDAPDADSARVAMWAAARRAVTRLHQGRSLLLVVDDAQWLDDTTADFLSHIATGESDLRLLLLLNGRNDVRQSARWSTLRSHLISSGALCVELSALDGVGTQDLVDDLRPQMNGALRSAVSREIFGRSAGLPGIAKPLLAAMPDGSAVLPDVRTLTQNQPLATAIQALTPGVRRVGVAAAVIGPRFRFDDLATVTGLADTEILDALDVLIDRGLLTDRSLVDFEVVHALVERSFLGASSRNELADFNRRAADLFDGDVHRRARHLHAALPLVPTRQAIDALKQSAEEWLREGAHRECVRQFSTAEQLDRDALSPSELGRLARAQDLCGMHEQATATRQRGFDQAADDRSWAIAMQIAVSGLPEAEGLDGDPALVANLRRIDASELAQADAWQLALVSTRQLSILGADSEALDAADVSRTLAATPGQHVAAAVQQRLAMSGDCSPADSLDVLLAVREHSTTVSSALRADYLLSVAIDQYQVGETTDSDASLALIKAMDGRSVVKEWQRQLMRAMRVSDDGRLDEAAERRASAHALAAQAGLGEADNALLAATFVETWICGDAALFRAEVDGGALDPSHRLLTKAGASAVLWASDEQRQSVELAEEAALEAMEGTRPQRLSVLAVIAEPLAQSSKKSLIGDAAEAFESAGNSMLVLAAGAASLGPVRRYRAMLETDPVHRVKLLRSAMDLADRAVAPLWQAIVRRDLLATGPTDVGDLAMDFERLLGVAQLGRLTPK